MTDSNGTQPSYASAAALAGLAAEVEGLRRVIDPLRSLPERVGQLAALLAHVSGELATFTARSAPPVAPSWLMLPADPTTAHVVLEELTGWMGAVYLRYPDAAVNRTGIARGRGSGHRALLGDDLTIHGFPFNGGMLSIDEWILSVLYQWTHFAASRSTSRSPLQFCVLERNAGISVLYSPIVDSINALSNASPTVPIEPAMPASRSSSVNARAVYCDPASE